MKDNKKYIIIGICIIVLLIGSIWGLLYLKNRNNNKPVNEENKTETSEVIKNTEVSFKNYVYTINDKQSYVLDNDNENMIVFFGENDNWDAYVEIVPNSANRVFSNPQELHDILLDNGYIINDAKEITISGNKVLVMDYFKDNYVALIAYMQGKDDDVYEITIYDDVNNIFHYEYLGELIEILSSGNN